MHLIRFFILILPVCLFVKTSQAQYYFRIECDISIKGKTGSGETSLVMGRVFYDRNINKLVYDLNFPEKETWVMRDTIVYVHRQGGLETTRGMEQFNQSTVFFKILEGQLNNYGLRGSTYTVEDVKRDGDLVITTWKPPSNSKTQDRIYTSTANDALYGVVITDPAGEIVSRQLFQKYTTVRGLRIPTEIIQVLYRGGSEDYQVFTLSNIRINHQGNENMYNYPVVGH